MAGVLPVLPAPPALEGQGPARPTALVVVCRGSQYSIKAVSMLRHCGIELEYRAVSIDPKIRKKVLHAPFLLPVMQWGATGEVVTDTTCIARFIHARLQSPTTALLYGADDASRARTRALEKKCDELYWLFTSLTFRKQNSDNFYAHQQDAWQGSRLPCLLKCIRCCRGAEHISKMIQGLVRGASEKQLSNKKRTGVDVSYIKGLCFDELLARIRRELALFEDLLQASATPHLLGTPGPTVADFALYGQLHRPLGDSFGMASAGVFPELLTGARPRLRKLEAWWAHMEATHHSTIPKDVQSLRKPLPAYIQEPAFMPPAGVAAPAAEQRDPDDERLPAAPKVPK